MSPESAETAHVLGVDGCKKGWVGFTNRRRGYFGSTIGELVEHAECNGVIDVVGIDIPIGLPTTGARQADVEARRLLGKRGSSVFPTPIRAALEASTHGDATAISAAATGKGISQQAYALRAKVLEIDDWVRSAGQVVIEVHPEVCFTTMAGHPPLHSKATWAGAEERRALLASAGFAVPADIGLAGAFAGVDDVLDAAAAAWTALRFAQGLAVSYPEVPEVFETGRTAAIWA